MNKNYLTLTITDVECYQRAKVSMDRGAGTSKRQGGGQLFQRAFLIPTQWLCERF